MSRRRGPAELLRPRRDDDAGVGMLQVVLVLLVTATMSVAVLGTVVGQVVPTAAERARVRSVSAADGGLEAGLAVVRSATATVPGVGEVGDLGRLPCTTAALPLRLAGGAAPASDGAASTASAVVVRYFLDDPAQQPETWRAANAMPCTVGTGLLQAPAYALVQSVATTTGTDRLPADWTDRSVEVVYTFNRTDAATAGGQVKVGAYSASSDLCWTAPTSTPAAGSVPALQPCDGADDRQQWAFRDDYSVVLGPTQSAPTGVYDGMCLTAEPRGREDLTDHGLAGAALTPSSTTAVTTELLGPVAGSARAFSGTSSWLASFVPAPAPAEVTVSAWFRTTSRSGTVVGFGGDPGTTGTTPDRLLWLDSAGRLVWGVSPSAEHTVTSTAGYADGTWHHVAASVGPAGTLLYVDGAQVAGDSWTTAGTTAGYWHVGWGGELAAGWLQAPSNPYWQGGLAHVAVVERQLAASEVASLATAATWDAQQAALTALAPRSSWPLGGSWEDPAVFLATCDGGAHQKWAYNDGGRIEVARPDASRLSGGCVTPVALAAGSALTMAADCGTAQEWTPSSTVGAGAAGDVTGQLVNFGEYGRCLDVTNQDVGWPYLIDFPCKADPTQPVRWNQRFTVDAQTGQIVTPSPSGSYCLRTASAAGGYVLTVPCSLSDPAQRWTRNGSTGFRLTAYTIVDADGRCLSLGPPGAASGGLAQWSSIVAAACDGSRVQKWNAPPQLAGAGVAGYRETTLDR